MWIYYRLPFFIKALLRYYFILKEIIKADLFSFYVVELEERQNKIK